MSLDDKISKYLDGELSEEEDFFLRHEVSKNPTAREKFDASVGLHLAFREDAESVFPPEDLVQSTEDIVLMKILAQAPDNIERSYTWRRSAVLVSFIFLFLLGSLFKISDINFKNPLILRIPLAQIEQENQNTKNRDLSYSDLNINTRIHITNNNSDAVMASNVRSDRETVNTEFNEENANITEEAKQDVISNEQAATGIKNNLNATGGAGNSQNNLKPAARLFTPVPAPGTGNTNHQGSILEKKSNDLANKESEKKQFVKPDLGPLSEKVNPALFTPINGVDMFSSKDEIHVSSFFGTDFVRSGIATDSKVPVSHFSQSIAYAVNTKERLGVEVGYTEYGYNENVIFKKPVGLNSEHVLVVNIVNNPGSGPNDMIDYPASISRKMEMFWGSAFYERSLIEIKSFSIDGRLGVGASSDGPLGYGRLYATYELFSGFSLSMGTEGRVFVAQMPISALSGNSVKGTGSLIYGIQIKF